jgi:N-acetylglutamate synthase-like GNAT family acetyltransferase
MLLNLRHAKQSDKNNVLRFCTNTFEWGDYIEQVWDLWYSDPNGYLMVEEEEDNGVIAAVSHAYVCPNRNRVWLEGIRVNPDFRRKSIGTKLIKKMLEYGKEQGAKEAAAVVSVNNIASQAMMEKNGFVVTSIWSYCYSTDKLYQKPETGQARIATLKDKEMISSYLKQSQIFRAAEENYVDSWRWYHLDLGSGVLQNLIDNKKVVIIMGTHPSIIDGVMIINKYNNNVFQIGYLDASDVLTIRHLIAFVINLAYYELTEKRCEKLQMFVPHMPVLQSFMAESGINQYGQFLLYRLEY